MPNVVVPFTKIARVELAVAPDFNRNNEGVGETVGGTLMLGDIAAVSVIAPLNPPMLVSIRLAEAFSTG